MRLMARRIPRTRGTRRRPASVRRSHRESERAAVLYSRHGLFIWIAHGKLAVIGVCVAGLTLPTPARACSPAQPGSPSALPAPGATNVSTATSIIVLSPSEPFGVALQVNGQSAPVHGWTALGGGIDDHGASAQYWQLRLDPSILEPEAEYVLSLPWAGEALELTRFTTGPGYDKTAGTRPPSATCASGVFVIRSRPSARAAACSPDQSFITIDDYSATIPNTELGSVVQRFSLSPKTGG